MAPNLEEGSVWAAGVAARLRLLQVDCADVLPAQRREHLHEVLADALKDIPDTRRDSYLAALGERFPTWSTPATFPPPPPPVTPIQQTPEEMVDSLIAAASELTPASKAALTRKLLKSGLVPQQTDASADSRDLQARLGLAGSPHSDRIVPLLAMLADLLDKLDQVACKTLENLPERPDFKLVNEGDLGSAIRAYLVAEGEAGTESSAQPSQRVMEKHRRALVALIASHVGIKGVPSVGRDFARWFHEYFSPQNIEDVVRAEKGARFALNGSLEERCWKKYSQRFREDLSTPEYIDRKVKDAVANTVERIFQLRI